MAEQAQVRCPTNNTTYKQTRPELMRKHLVIREVQRLGNVRSKLQTEYTLSVETVSEGV